VGNYVASLRAANRNSTTGKHPAPCRPSRGRPARGKHGGMILVESSFVTVTVSGMATARETAGIPRASPPSRKLRRTADTLRCSRMTGIHSRRYIVIWSSRRPRAPRSFVLCEGIVPKSGKRKRTHLGNVRAREGSLLLGGSEEKRIQRIDISHTKASTLATQSANARSISRQKRDATRWPRACGISARRESPWIPVGSLVPLSSLPGSHRIPEPESHAGPSADRSRIIFRFTERPIDPTNAQE